MERAAGFNVRRSRDRLMQTQVAVLADSAAGPGGLRDTILI